jgi:hypothetical protein
MSNQKPVRFEILGYSYVPTYETLTVGYATGYGIASGINGKRETGEERT